MSSRAGVDSNPPLITIMMAVLLITIMAVAGLYSETPKHVFSQT